MKMLGDTKVGWDCCSRCSPRRLRRKTRSSARMAEKLETARHIADELQLDPEDAWTWWERQCALADEEEQIWGYWMLPTEIAAFKRAGRYTSEAA